MLQETPEENPKDLLDKQDPYTGFSSEDSQQKQDLDQLQKILVQGEALSKMKNTPGWAYLEDFLLGQVKNLTDHLKIEQNVDKIRYLQAEILAFESLPNLIEKCFVDLESAKQKIEDFYKRDEP